jgi:hypothetical protein
MRGIVREDARLATLDLATAARPSLGLDSLGWNVDWFALSYVDTCDDCA